MRPVPVVPINLSPDELAVLLAFLSRYEPPERRNPWHMTFARAAAKIERACLASIR